MATNGSTQSTAPQAWPIPKFHFNVKWASVPMVTSFQEVSGLDAQHQVIEYRAGDSKSFTMLKMPGLSTFSNVVMKKAVFKSDNKFWDWYNQIRMNTIKRETVTVNLLDESGKPTMSWTLLNAWPCKITGTDLNAEGNEVAVESIEIAHEGLTIANS